MWAVKPKSSAWWPPPSMCVADITSLPTRHPSSGSTETSHLASPGSSHVTQISHDGRQFRHRVFPPQLPPWPPQRRWRWLEVRLPRPSESDAPRTGADLPKPEWQSCAQTLPLRLGQKGRGSCGTGKGFDETKWWVASAKCRWRGKVEILARCSRDPRQAAYYLSAKNQGEKHAGVDVEDLGPLDPWRWIINEPCEIVAGGEELVEGIDKTEQI